MSDDRLCQCGRRIMPPPPGGVDLDWTHADDPEDPICNGAWYDDEAGEFHDAEFAYPAAVPGEGETR